MPSRFCAQETFSATLSRIQENNVLRTLICEAWALLFCTVYVCTLRQGMSLPVQETRCVQAILSCHVKVLTGGSKILSGVSPFWSVVIPFEFVPTLRVPQVATKKCWICWFLSRFVLTIREVFGGPTVASAIPASEAQTTGPTRVKQGKTLKTTKF